MPEGPIRHLSYSQISTYLICPLRYRFHYVDLIPPAFKSASLAFGSSIHEAVAAYYQSRLEGDTLRTDQMVDVYRDTWRNAEGVKFFNGDGEESLLQKAQQLISVFHEQVDPHVTVLGVEEFFEVQLAKEVPPFHGYIDLIEQSVEGVVSVVDLKTAARKPTKAQASSNLQLTAYTLGAEALGFDPDGSFLRILA